MDSSMQQTDARDSLQHLLGLLYDAEQLAGNLGLSDLAANQKFWQLRLLQLQQQQQQEDIQERLRQHGVQCTNRVCLQDAMAQAGQPSASPSASPPQSSREAAELAHAQGCCSHATGCNNSGALASHSNTQQGFTMQFPLTLTRPLGPYEPATEEAALRHKQLDPHVHHHRQQQQQDEFLHQTPRPALQHQELELPDQQQQQQQQQQEEEAPWCEESLLDQPEAQQEHTSRDPPPHPAAAAAIEQQHQQQPSHISAALEVAGSEEASWDHHNQQTSMLDALAVAAAAASEDPTALEQSYPDPAAPACSSHLAPDSYAGQPQPPAAAGTPAGEAGRAEPSPSGTPAAAEAPAAVIQAASSSLPVPQDEGAAPSAAHAGNTQGPAIAAAIAAVAAAAAGGVPAPAAPATAAVMDSPSDSSTQHAESTTGAVESRVGGQFRKSSLLELGDQIGAQAVAIAQAAAEQGRPLSYLQVMQLLQPLDAGVCCMLGLPLRQPTEAEVQLDDVRKLFFFNLPHAARHFGMGTTKFKPLLRSLGITYWPQRQFMALVEALNFLSEKSPGSRDLIDVPGRMLVLHHAWYWLNHHPNMQLDHHASSAVKKAIHKQSFKGRQKQQQPVPTRRAKRAHAEMEAQSAAVAAAAAAAAGNASVAEEAAAPPADVKAQVYQALAVWPQGLEYLAAQAAQLLQLPLP